MRRIGLRIMRGKATALLIASSLVMGLSSLPAKADCSKLEVLACAAAYAGGGGVLSVYCAKCLFISLDTSGQGSERETLTARTSPLRATPYGDPKKGFGDYTPVTLPPERGHPAGKDTGIPIRMGTATAVPPPQYFRPR
jgi:hypothetical protein